MKIAYEKIIMMFRVYKILDVVLEWFMYDIMYHSRIILKDTFGYRHKAATHI